MGMSFKNPYTDPWDRYVWKFMLNIKIATFGILMIAVPAGIIVLCCEYPVVFLGIILLIIISIIIHARKTYLRSKYKHRHRRRVYPVTKRKI